MIDLLQASTKVHNKYKQTKNSKKESFNQNYTKEIYPPETPYSCKKYRETDFYATINSGGTPGSRTGPYSI
jgi:hypothetical protein